MENRFFINICSDRFPEEILLETQGNLPLGEILQDILKILNWPIEVDGKAVKYLLRTEETILDQTKTLLSAGVGNFDPIWIIPDEHQQENSFHSEKTLPIEEISNPSMQQPYWSSIPVDQPCLIHPDGFMIIIGTTPVLIGRPGGSMPVQIDLTEFEKGHLISSRNHVEILLRNGDFYLRPLKTRNGTFVGRDELEPNEIRRLKNNDMIQFGNGGVQLIFRKPEADIKKM